MARQRVQPGEKEKDRPWGTIIGDRDELSGGSKGPDRVAIEFRDADNPSQRTWKIFNINDVEFPTKRQPKRRLDKKHPFIDDAGYCLKIFVGDIPITDHEDLTKRDEFLRQAIKQSRIGSEIRKVQRTHCDIPNYTNETGFAHIIMQTARVASQWIERGTVEILKQTCKVERMKRDTYKYMPEPFKDPVEEGQAAGPGDAKAEELPGLEEQRHKEENLKEQAEEKRRAKEKNRQIRLQRRAKVGWRYIEIAFPKYDTRPPLGIAHLNNRIINITPGSIADKHGIQQGWDIRLINGWKADTADSELVSAKLKKGRQKHLKVEFDTRTGYNGEGKPDKEKVEAWKDKMNYSAEVLATAVNNRTPVADVETSTEQNKIIIGGGSARKHFDATHLPTSIQTRRAQIGGQRSVAAMRQQRPERDDYGPTDEDTTRSAFAITDDDPTKSMGKHDRRVREIVQGSSMDGPSRSDMSEDTQRTEVSGAFDDPPRERTLLGELTEHDRNRLITARRQRIRPFGTCSTESENHCTEISQVGEDGKSIYRFFFTDQASRKIWKEQQKRNPKERNTEPAIFLLRVLVPDDCLKLLGATARDEIKRKARLRGMKFMSKTTPGHVEGKRILQFKGSQQACEMGRQLATNLGAGCELLKFERLPPKKSSKQEGPTRAGMASDSTPKKTVQKQPAAKSPASQWHGFNRPRGGPGGRWPSSRGRGIAGRDGAPLQMRRPLPANAQVKATGSWQMSSGGGSGGGSNSRKHMGLRMNAVPGRRANQIAGNVRSTRVAHRPVPLDDDPTRSLGGLLGPLRKCEEDDEEPTRGIVMLDKEPIRSVATRTAEAPADTQPTRSDEDDDEDDEVSSDDDSDTQDAGGVVTMSWNISGDMVEVFRQHRPELLTKFSGLQECQLAAPNKGVHTVTLIGTNSAVTKTQRHLGKLQRKHRNKEKGLIRKGVGYAPKNVQTSYKNGIPYT